MVRADELFSDYSQLPVGVGTGCGQNQECFVLGDHVSFHQDAFRLTDGVMTGHRFVGWAAVGLTANAVPDRREGDSFWCSRPLSSTMVVEG